MAQNLLREGGAQSVPETEVSQRGRSTASCEAVRGVSGVCSGSRLAFSSCRNVVAGAVLRLASGVNATILH